MNELEQHEARIGEARVRVTQLEAQAAELETNMRERRGLHAADLKPYSENERDADQVRMDDLQRKAREARGHVADLEAVTPHIKQRNCERIARNRAAERDKNHRELNAMYQEAVTAIEVLETNVLKRFSNVRQAVNDTHNSLLRWNNNHPDERIELPPPEVELNIEEPAALLKRLENVIRNAR